jgi:predicted MFS family arabinose efflux permease
MKRILSVTFLNFLVSGGLTLTIPLLLLERKVDLIEIGVVISILPLFFMIIRLIFALAADLKGWNRFYLLINWPSALISTIIYFVANSIPIFLMGKIAEAFKESSYWAVNRTAIFSLSPEREEKEATRNTAVSLFSTALGGAMAGFGMAYLGFSSTLGLLVIASALIGFPAFFLWKMPKQNSLSSAKIRDLTNLKSRGRRFWSVSLIILFYSLARYPLITLLLPVFMSQQLGFSYTTIGIAYMTFNIIASIVALGTLRFALGAKRVVIQSVISLFALIFLANSNGFFFILLVALAITEGLGTGFFESIIARATKKKVSVSFDIGLLHVPMRLAEFSSVLYAGVVAQYFGYMPIFVFSGIFFTIFSVLSFRFLKISELND